MIAEALGLTVARTMPDSVVTGVLSGLYKVYGGVVRNQGGQIVAHLVNVGTSALPPVAAAKAALEAVNTVQLHRIASKVAEIREQMQRLEAATTQLVHLANGTMVLSGLTLAVSTAGFVFLHRKLGRIDEKLQALTRDVKAIRAFLERQEHARLSSALRTLSSLATVEDPDTRRALLIAARHTIAELYENYAAQLAKAERVEEVFPTEEYFTVTSLSLAACSAELDLRGQAVQELDDAHRHWLIHARRVGTEVIFRGQAHRFMQPKYVPFVRTDELIDWLDFVYGQEKSIGWVDDMRRDGDAFIRISAGKASEHEKAEIDLVRKLSARHQVFEGYLSSYGHLDSIGMRPSQFQAMVEEIPEQRRVEHCVLLLDKRLARETA